MDNNELPPSAVEGPELQAYFSQLHEHFRTNADAPVGAALAEFVDVIDLAPTPQLVAGSPTTSWRPKMLTGIGAFVATTTGKIVLGTTVAAASVGGMHAAEIVDVPLLPEPAVTEVLIEDQEGDDVEQDVLPADDGTENDEALDAIEEDDESKNTEDLADDGDMDDGDDTDGDGDDGSDEPKNHGAVVSEFAKNTELEGCEKGQAISALAKSKDKKNEAGDDDDAAGDEGEDQESASTETSDGDVAAEETSKCKSGDDDSEDEDEDSEEEEDDEEDDEDDGPPAGKGHNRDDHPGNGGKHSSVD